MVDRMEKRPTDWREGLLVPDWRNVRRWYDMLWWFDIEGARVWVPVIGRDAEAVLVHTGRCTASF